MYMTSDISATQYFKIDPKHSDAPRLAGAYNGEFLPDKEIPFGVRDTYMAHLAPGFRMPEGGVGHRWAREGIYAVVVEGVSREGWKAVLDAVGNAETRGQVLNRLIQLPYITWDVPHQDIGRLNEIARAAFIQTDR